MKGPKLDKGVNKGGSLALEAVKYRQRVWARVLPRNVANVKRCILRDTYLNYKFRSIITVGKNTRLCLPKNLGKTTKQFLPTGSEVGNNSGNDFPTFVMLLASQTEMFVYLLPSV